MTFIGDPFHHIPSSPEDDKTDLFRTCLYCGDNWPCEPTLIRRETIKACIARVKDIPTMNGGPHDPSRQMLDHVEKILKEIL